jgi:hypothetical protein
MSKTLHAVAIVALLATTPAATADVLIIDRLEAPQVEVPTRGTTMDRVESRFGAPMNASGPVGEPPITRWEYDGFVVFFEHRHVVHSVQKAGRPAPPAS